MSEGNHVASDAAPEEFPKPETPESTASKPSFFSRASKPLLITSGTAVCVLLAGLAFQAVTSSNSGTAAERPGRATVGQASAGNQSGAGRQSTKAALVTHNGRSIQIPLRDLYEECTRRIGDEVLDSMINRAVIQLACENAGVTVTQAEVEQEIIRIAQQFDIPVETWLQMLQTERNISPQQYSKDVIWPMLALKKLAGSDVEVSDEDMHEEFVRNFGPRARVKMIMLDNVRRANEVWQKANLNPGEFERLAREHSIDSNSRAMNGAVPPIARYSGSPKLEKAAFNLKPGEISGVIQVGHSSFVIMKCEGFTEQVVQDIEEVRDQLYADLVEKKVQEATAKLFENLKKDSTVHNYWNHTTTGNYKQVAGQAQPGSDKVQQATGTRPAKGNGSRR